MSSMKINRRIRIAWEPEVEWIIPLQVAPARAGKPLQSVELSAAFLAAAAASTAASAFYGRCPTPAPPQPRSHPHPPSPGPWYVV